jgi:hypothetical protein
VRSCYEGKNSVVNEFFFCIPRLNGQKYGKKERTFLSKHLLCFVEQNKIKKSDFFHFSAYFRE